MIRWGHRWKACYRRVLFLLLAVAAAPVAGQDRDDPDLARATPALPAIKTPMPGQTAEATSGRAGQRQTREAEAQLADTNPLLRISNRVSNRVQSRLRNRIDRDYDPTANATSPFKVANEQLLTGPRR